VRPARLGYDHKTPIASTTSVFRDPHPQGHITPCSVPRRPAWPLTEVPHLSAALCAFSLTFLVTQRELK
jgi:hypothetical protein